MENYWEGIDLYNKGDYEKASEIFLKLVNQDNTNHSAWNALGQTLIKRGNLSQAEECFSNALYLSPANEEYEKNLGETRQHISGKNPDEDSALQDQHRREGYRRFTPDHSDGLCLLIGLTLLGIYLLSFIPGSVIISPERELIAIGGIIFCAFFVSANFIRIFVQCRIPLRLIVFVVIVIILVLLFVKYLINH